MNAVARILNSKEWPMAIVHLIFRCLFSYMTILYICSKIFCTIIIGFANSTCSCFSPYLYYWNSVQVTYRRQWEEKKIISISIKSHNVFFLKKKKKRKLETTRQIINFAIRRKQVLFLFTGCNNFFSSFLPIYKSNLKQSGQVLFSYLELNEMEKNEGGQTHRHW